MPTKAQPNAGCNSPGAEAADPTLAQRFLDLLEPGGVFTFQTFDDNKDRKDRRLAKILHGTLGSHVAELVRLNEQGAQMLDAPISGGSEGAANGTLSIMIGGEAAQVERAMPYFRAMGTAITHVGAQGAGQTVKLVNQILVVVNMLAVSEALLFAQAGGLDLEKTLEAVTGGAAGSWMLSNRGSQAIVRDWRPGFTIDLQQKDLRLVLEAADQLGVPLVGTSTCFHLYRTLQARGLGDEGNHAMIKALEHLAGLELGGA